MKTLITEVLKKYVLSLYPSMMSNYDLPLYINVIYFPMSNTVQTHACDRS